MVRHQTVPIWFALLAVSAASGDSGPPLPRTGVYRLDFKRARPQLLRNELGDEIPSCGDGARATFDSMSKIVVDFDAMKQRAVVNGEEWIVSKNASGLSAGKSRTDCIWLTVKFRPASGGLLYASRCPERVCANFADYRGTFTAR